MTHVMVFVPEHPGYGILPETMQSLMALRWPGPKTLVLFRGANSHWFVNVNTARNYETARQLFLDSDCDVLVTIEADMIVPPDALHHLTQTEGDVVYGLYCWRYNAHWNVQQRLNPNGGWSWSANPAEAKRAWSAVEFDVAGAGQGCTLFRRNVLEHVPFRLFEGDEGTFAQDWPFAWDCQQQGFLQRGTARVVCGHIDLENNRVLWPDVRNPLNYREEIYNGH